MRGGELMKKIKKSLFESITHIPTTFLGFLIVVLGLILVYLKIVKMEQLTTFIIASLPFFFYKKEEKKDEDKTE